MSVTCRNGHVSDTEDFCDTCGVKIDPTAPPTPAAAAAPPPASAPGATSPAGTQTCPNCEAQSAPDSLFCEACGYDFTTGAMPRGTTAGAAGSPASSPPGPAGSSPAPGSAGSSSPPGSAGSSPLPEPAGSRSPAGIATPPARASAGASPTSPPGSIAPPTPLEWVAEVWIDPEWYAVQDAEDPLPSPGLPAVVPLTTRSALVGRVSTSRNIRPDVDCTSDTGVSRRHAQLTTDGRRWFVEDLGSSNGTYVGAAGEALPEDPIPVGSKRELEDDDRLYVGAWTRIVVRPATDEEKAAVAGGT